MITWAAMVLPFAPPPLPYPLTRGPHKEHVLWCEVHGGKSCSKVVGGSFLRPFDCNFLS